MRKSNKPRSHNVPPVTLSSYDDQKVLRFRDWCQLNGISERTGRRIIASPDGPGDQVVRQVDRRHHGEQTRMAASAGARVRWST